MAEDQAPQIQGKPVERVGVIIVHGIGEQKRFQFLEGETRKIVDAIIRQYGATVRRRYVTPTLTTGSGDSFLGAHSSWASGTEAPLHAHVELSDRTIIDIAFHEVWWADINETLTLGKQIRFWWWGLSLPGIAPHHEQVLTGAKLRTRLPKNSDRLPLHNRLRMAFVSMLFGFSAFSIALINTILKRLDFSPFLSSDILVNYLSGVKLYSQDKRAGGSPMDGPDEPPRAAIRRRMIRVMIDVARAEYHRWYILAHSLGTIVAWNGLMEIQQALPNYLARECWKKLGKPLRRTIDDPFPVDGMMPSRPLWVNDDEIISRDALFEKFRGVLTYGSPLERFCALWSDMVPINIDEDPFLTSADWTAEWVNVYDPTDPVGTWIFDYDPDRSKQPRPGHTALTPQNFPCRASPILLYSHIQYLRSPKRDAPRAQDYLVNQIARWLVTGDSLAEEIKKAVEKDNTAFWMPRSDGKDETRKLVFGRLIWRWIQDAIVAIALAVLTLFSLNKVIYPATTTILDWLHLTLVTSAIDSVVSFFAFGNSYISNIVIELFLLIVATGMVILIASLLQYVSSTRDHKELAETYERRMPKTSEKLREPKDDAKQ